MSSIASNTEVFIEIDHIETIKDYINKCVKIPEHIFDKLPSNSTTNEILEQIRIYNDDCKSYSGDLFDKLSKRQASLAIISNGSENSYSKSSNEDSVDKINSSIEFIIRKYKIDRSSISVISSLSDFINLCDSFNSDYISRGQKNCEYSFLPSALRKDRNVRKYSDALIDEMFQEFKRKLYHYNPEFKGKNEYQLMSFAQHHGLPTKLLDFTESHLVSLLFSVEDYSFDEKDGLIFFVNPSTFNEQYIGTNSIIDSEVLDDKKDYCEKFFFMNSGDIHKRVHVQKGCFLHFPPKKSEIDSINAIKSHLKVAIIDKNAKEDLLKELFNIGLNFENIYPDLDNAVNSIIFKYKLKESEKNE